MRKKARLGSGSPDGGLERMMEDVYRVVCIALNTDNLLPHVQITKLVERREILLTFYDASKDPVNWTISDMNRCIDDGVESDEKKPLLLPISAAEKNVAPTSPEAVTSGSISSSFLNEISKHVPEQIDPSPFLRASTSRVADLLVGGPVDDYEDMEIDSLDVAQNLKPQKECARMYGVLVTDCWVQLERIDGARATLRQETQVAPQVPKPMISDQGTSLRRQSNAEVVAITTGFEPEDEYTGPVKRNALVADNPPEIESMGDEGDVVTNSSIATVPVELSSSVSQTLQKDTSLKNDSQPVDEINSNDTKSDEINSNDTKSDIDKKSILKKRISPKSSRKKKKKYPRSRRIRCEICDYGCSEKIQLKRHVAYHHWNIRPATLLYPKKKRAYKCDQCDYVGSCPRSLRFHVGTRHAIEKPYKCNLCTYQTANQEYLSIHMKKHEESSKPKLPKTQQTILCDSCEFSCTSNTRLKDHIATKHSTEEPFKCVICPYKTALKRNLTSHLKCHSDKKPYLCGDCNYRCKTSCRLNQHRRSMHFTEETLVSCPHCSHKAKTTSSLAGHVNRNHLRDVKMKQRKCEQCDYSTDDPYCMKSHIAQHGEATFECKECGGLYKSPKCLRAHMRTAHDKAKDCSIQCSHCDQTFQTRKHLNAHMSCVTGDFPYTCRICEVGYMVGSVLKKHFAVHHVGELIFYCGACEFGTNSKQALKVHENGSIHSLNSIRFQSKSGTCAAEKILYKCEECAYRNPSLSCLKRHVSIKHLPRN